MIFNSLFVYSIGLVFSVRTFGIYTYGCIFELSHCVVSKISTHFLWLLSFLDMLAHGSALVTRRFTMCSLYTSRLGYSIRQ